MKTSSLVAIIIAIIVVAGGVWYFMAQPGTSTPLTSQPASSTDQDTGSTATAPGTVLGVSQSASLGSYLVASANNMTLYTYSPDKPDVSNCNGQCAVNWPPLVVPAGTQLGQLTGATGTLGTITRADGSLQVTYNHMPLYFYIKDKNPGDTVGQGVGGVWYVLKP